MSGRYACPPKHPPATDAIDGASVHLRRGASIPCDERVHPREQTVPVGATKRNLPGRCRAPLRCHRDEWPPGFLAMATRYQRLSETLSRQAPRPRGLCHAFPRIRGTLPAGAAASAFFNANANPNVPQERSVRCGSTGRRRGPIHVSAGEAAVGIADAFGHRRLCTTLKVDRPGLLASFRPAQLVPLAWSVPWLQRDRRGATLFVHRSFLSSAVYAHAPARDALLGDAKRLLSELKRVREAACARSCRHLWDALAMETIDSRRLTVGCVDLQHLGCALPCRRVCHRARPAVQVKLQSVSECNLQGSNCSMRHQHTTCNMQRTVQGKLQTVSEGSEGASTPGGRTTCTVMA